MCWQEWRGEGMFPCTVPKWENEAIHCNDVIMSAMTSRRLYCVLNRAQIKENIKAPCHWPLWGEFTCDRWISLTKGSWCGKFLRWRHHVMPIFWCGNSVNSTQWDWGIHHSCCHIHKELTAPSNLKLIPSVPMYYVMVMNFQTNVWKLLQIILLLLSKFSFLNLSPPIPHWYDTEKRNTLISKYKTVWKSDTTQLANEGELWEVFVN